MVNINYKCNDCRVEFSGGDYTDSCPDCGSDSIITIHTSSIITKIKGYFQENQMLGIIFGIIILIIGIFTIKTCVNTTNNIDSANKEYKLKFEQNDNFIKIVIYSREKDSKDNFKVEDANANPIYTGFKSIQNNKLIRIYDGEIYPCKSGSIQIRWNYKFYKNKKHLWKRNETIINFSFKNNAEPNKNANCKTPPIINFKQNENCILEILSSWDTLYPTEILMVSINGKIGTYTNNNKYSFTPDGPKKYDIWYFYKNENDTNFVQEGEGSCNCFDKLDIVNAKNKLISICENYGNNPSNLNYLSVLKQKIGLYHIVLKFNGENIDINTISNDFRVDNNNNGTKYKAVVTMSGNNYMDVKTVINFTEK